MKDKNMEKKKKIKDTMKKKKQGEDMNPVVDDRFKSMFTDKNFKLKYVTDKRGQPIDHTSSKDLREFYSISTSDDDDDANKEDGQKALKETKRKIKKLVKLKKDKCWKKDDDDEETKNIDQFEEEQRTGESDSSNAEDDCSSKPDVLESDDSSETSSDTSEEDEDNLDNQFDHKWEELDANAEVASSSTKRLALCHMDWDRIRAEDILAVFNSFKPANGIIHSVKIYPSDFGLQRMEEEKLNGPAELVERILGSDEENVKEDKEGSKYHREKLRQYQLNRLKYYYAVIECDSPETADSLYEQLNGMEYESSAVSMDLRFIPDDVTFDQEPKWAASSAPDPTEYRPKLFTNSALQQVRVNLTWDETDPKRRDTIRRAFKEPESIEKDIKNYLASSSGSSSEDEDVSEDAGKQQGRKIKLDDRISKYKALLQSIEDKEKEQKNKFEMELTWEPGLKEKTVEKVKEKIEKETFTPFEEKLKKKKQETKEKKKERKKLLNRKEATDSDGSGLESADNICGFDSENREIDRDENKMADELALLVSESHEKTLARTKRHGKKEKKKKLKEKKEDDFEIDVDDPRFSAIYTSHEFNIDPSNPHFKDSKHMQKIMQEKLKKKRKYESADPKPTKKHQKLSIDDSNIDDSIVLI